MDHTTQDHSLQKAGMENSHDLLQALLTDSDQPITIQDGNGNILAWNKAAELRYGCSDGDTIGRNTLAFVPAPEHSAVGNWLSFMSPGQTRPLSLAQRIARSGCISNIELVGSVVTNQNSGAALLISTERTPPKASSKNNDDNEGEVDPFGLGLQQTIQQLTIDNKTLRMTLGCIGDAVIITDTLAKICFLNPVAEQLLGWSNREAASIMLSQVLKLITESSRETPENPVVSCLRSHEITRLLIDTALIRRDGREISIDDTAAPIRDLTGEVIGAVMIFRDVTDKRELIRELRHQALHDSLTGLDNRRSLELTLTTLLERPQPREPGALLYLDLDQFKVVNDTGGHAAGDMVLHEVGCLLRAHARVGDKIARLGGDEFGILLENCSQEQARRIGNQIRERIAAFPFSWETRRLTLGVSLGIVPIPASGGSLSSLFTSADDACYSAKHRGGNRVHVFEQDDSTVLQRHDEMQWVERINNALQNDHFRLYSQPIVALGAAPHQEWAEVLLRMQGEDGGMIQPGLFIPAAERYGLITAIDRWVVRRSLEALLSRRLVVFSINISGPSLSDDGFLAYVMEQFHQTGIHGSQVRFEITETAAITSVTHAMRFISLLKGLGCQFALDDFGTGLCSYSYLKNLSIDYLKIPGRFIENMTRDSMDHAMVEGIHRTSRAMGTRTVAEHVENPATYEALKLIGVDYVQGYMLGRPLEIDPTCMVHV
jgi:diguanylate cyclase (GGDEF)-like protein/PAS domain S-box-containing protein